MLQKPVHTKCGIDASGRYANESQSTDLKVAEHSQHLFTQSRRWAVLGPCYMRASPTVSERSDSRSDTQGEKGFSKK